MYIIEVERELLGRILVGMKNGSLSIAKARLLAKAFVDGLPLDDDGLCRMLDSLADEYREARVVYIKYAIPYKEEKRKQKIAVVTGYVRRGDVENALKVLKKGPARGPPKGGNAGGGGGEKMEGGGG